MLESRRWFSLSLSHVHFYSGRRLWTRDSPAICSPHRFVGVIAMRVSEYQRAPCVGFSVE